MAAEIKLPCILLFSAPILLALLTAKPAAASPKFFSGEQDALNSLLNSLTSPASLLSNWSGPPCSHNRTLWLGVLCSDSHIIALFLDARDLSGSLPATAFHNLPRLTNLSLHDNSLHGNLPSLRNLTHLQEALFSRNRFSGKIPEELLSLLNLSRLELQENHLNGTVPPFHHKSLVAFNVSCNFLEGRIPRTPVLGRFDSSAFDSNVGLCGEPLRKECPLPGAATGSVHVSVWLIVLVSVASFLASIAVALRFYVFRESLELELAEAIEQGILNITEPGDDEGGIEPLFFFTSGDYTTLTADQFMQFPALRQANGMVGSTYTVIFPSGMEVAAKRLRAVDLSREEFYDKVQQLTHLEHENIGRVIGCYSSQDRDHKFIIFEHVGGRSLFHLLHGREEGDVELNSRNRLLIAKGIARGLNYLHQFREGERVPHGNLKSSNVIISDPSNPKLVNFGLIPLLPPSALQRLSVGMTPEVCLFQEQEMSRKTDMYCLGVLLLELVTGINPMGGERWLVEQVENGMKLGDGEWQGDLLDAKIVGEIEGHGIMFKILEIAIDCTALEPESRPEMDQVLRRIESID